MAVRNTSKSKKNRAAKSTKSKSKSKKSISNRSTPETLFNSAPFVVIEDDLIDTASEIEIVEVCDDESTRLEDEMEIECEDEDDEDGSESDDDVAMEDTTNDEISLMVDESVSTINSLHASPANRPGDDVEMSEHRGSCRLSEANNDDIRLEGIHEDDEDMEPPLPPKPQFATRSPSSLFSRIFGGFNLFSRLTNSSSSSTNLNNIPPAASRDTPPVLEVIHVFPDPQAALGHEGLKDRQRQRLRRASIQSNTQIVDCEDVIDVPYKRVSDIPSNERVVLLRQVLSPRDEQCSQDVIVDKAAHRPDLWVFLPFSYCKVYYATELCDYLNRRCSWPSSRVNSPSKNEAREITPVVEMSLPPETPLMNFVPNDLPPNSIDAPVKCNMNRPGTSSDSHSNYLRCTPMTLPTPPQVCSKQNDEKCVERPRDEVENENIEPNA